MNQGTSWSLARKWQHRAVGDPLASCKFRDKGQPAIEAEAVGEFNRLKGWEIRAFAVRFRTAKLFSRGAMRPWIQVFVELDPTGATSRPRLECLSSRR